MRLRDKGKKDGEPVSMGWDEAQAALRAGTHEVADEAGSGSEKPREGEQGDDLDAKTKPELEALAKERGLDVSAAKTKADLIEALRKA
ncbi:Rho termination factor N-terminal domain-containing protein [Methylorubrum extorquens]